jgi:hypothetical protein
MPTSTPPVRRQRRRRSSPAVCGTCKETFPSRNALFAHVNKELHFLRSCITSKSFRPIVASKAQRRKVGTGTAFKDFSYCEVHYQFSPTSPDSWGCVDTGSGMSLVDESVLESGALSSRKSQSPVHIKGVGDEMYLSKESVVLDVFFPDVTNTRLAKITREFHIVQDMDCGLLIGNDIIEPEGIVINLAKKRMQISACDNMACQLKVRRKQRESSHVVVRCAQSTVVRAGAHLIKEQVPIRFSQLEKRYYPFKASSNLPKGCHLFMDRMSGHSTDIIVYNWSDKDVTFPKDFKFGYIELPEPPQYTSVKPMDVVQCHFRKVTEPEPQRSSTVTNEVTTASTKATHSRQVPKKTSSLSESAPKMSPQSVRCPPPSLRTSVPLSFSPVRSLLPPLRRSPFFFSRPQFLFSLSFPPPSTTNQGFNIPLGFYVYLLCRQPPYFPPKPGLQLPPLVKLFTFATNC